MKTRLSCLFLALMLLAVGCRKKPTETTLLLCKAAKAGDINKVQSLIASGADVNAKIKDDYTPLHFAVEHGHKNIVELLIKNNADINSKTLSGNTPLHGSAEFGDKNVVELLISSCCGNDFM